MNPAGGPGLLQAPVGVAPTPQQQQQQQQQQPQQQQQQQALLQAPVQQSAAPQFVPAPQMIVMQPMGAPPPMMMMAGQGGFVGAPPPGGMMMPSVGAPPPVANTVVHPADQRPVPEVSDLTPNWNVYTTDEGVEYYHSTVTYVPPDCGGVPARTNGRGCLALPFCLKADRSSATRPPLNSLISLFLAAQ